MGSLADISKTTGLGVTTVSEILRNKPGYREETRRLVIAAAERLNYRPNLVARGLKAGRSKTIGVMVGSLHTPIAMIKVSDLERTARQAGYTTFITHCRSDHPESTLEMVENLLARQVDGVIIMQPLSPGEPVVNRLQRAKTPTVYVNWAPAGAKWQVAFDRLSALEDAAVHLAELGHKRTAFMCSPTDWACPHLKVDLWRAALRKVGVTLEMDESYLLKPSSDFESQVYELVQTRAKEGVLPSALLLTNDTCAMAAMAGVMDMGMSVPGDVSVVGFDDVREAKYVRPALSTIHQPRSEVGNTAFAVLLEAMNGSSEGKRIVLEHQFVARDSTGPAKNC